MKIRFLRSGAFPASCHIVSCLALGFALLVPARALAQTVGECGAGHGGKGEALSDA